MLKLAKLLVLGGVCALLGQCAPAHGETVAERFDKAMKKKAEYCKSHKIDPANRRCDILDLKPADPLATEEGRFAHSIKIPNPVPEDSGYKPGMTPQEYFDHLCKTEAGEFIYKTVENVDGLYMMRPRKEATDNELSHLYALEDPYGHENWEATEPGGVFVHPNRYQYVELPVGRQLESELSKPYLHASRFLVPPRDAVTQRYFGYDGREQKTLQKEFDTKRKSLYGYTWRGITRPHDRELGIAGGELIVLDLETSEVLGVKRGYVRSGTVKDNLTGVWWLNGQVCKKDRTGLKRSYEFISLALHPFSLKRKGTPDGAK